MASNHDKNNQEIFKKCKESFLFFALGCYSFDWIISTSLYGDLDSKENLIIKKSRQIGMTTALSLFVIWYATFHDNKRILYVSPRLDMNNGFKSKIDSNLRTINFFGNELGANFSYKNISQLAINSSTVIFKTQYGFPTCGELYDLIILDEADFFDNLEHVWNCVLPCANKNSKIIIGSTPSGKGKMFENMINSAQSKKGIFSEFTFTNIVTSGQ